MELAIAIAAPARAVYELAKDLERFPAYMPDVESVRVLSREAGRLVTAWSTLVEDASIEWTEEDVFDDEHARITYRALDGDLERFEGVWSFETSTDDTTHVRLTIDYDFGVPSLAELIGPTLDATVRKNGTMMLRALKTEAEYARHPLPTAVPHQGD